MSKRELYLKWIKTHDDVFMDMVRIYLGLGLIGKAIYFMANPDYFTRLMTQAGDLWFAPAMTVHYVILAHLVGGLFLILGLLTRLAAAIQVPILVGAVFYVYMPKMVSPGPRQDLEFSALVLFLLIVIMIRGAGRFSLDHYISRKSMMHPMSPRVMP